MRDVEVESGGPRIALVLAGEHVLSDVAAAPRLRSRIPRCPPGDPEQRRERDHREDPDSFDPERPDREDRFRRAEPRSLRRERGMGGAHPRFHRGDSADRQKPTEKCHISTDAVYTVTVKPDPEDEKRKAAPLLLQPQRLHRS